MAAYVLTIDLPCAPYTCNTESMVRVLTVPINENLKVLVKIFQLINKDDADIMYARYRVALTQDLNGDQAEFKGSTVVTTRNDLDELTRSQYISIKLKPESTENEVEVLLVLNYRNTNLFNVYVSVQKSQ